MTREAVRRRDMMLRLDWMAGARRRAAFALELGFIDSYREHIREFDRWHASLQRLKASTP